MESSSSYKETRTVRHQTTTTTGVIDKRYFHEVLGIVRFVLKVMEVVGLLIAFICVIVSLPCAGHIVTFEYFKGISMFYCLTTVMLFLFLLFQLHVRLLRCDCCIGRWPIFELGYYVSALIFLFFADLFLSLHGCLAGHKAGVFFGWVAFSAYGVDTLFAFYFYCKSCRSSSSSSTSQTTTNVTTISQPEDAKY